MWKLVGLLVSRLDLVQCGLFPFSAPYRRLSVEYIAQRLNISSYMGSAQSSEHIETRRTKPVQPANFAICVASALGMLPSAISGRPMYHAPMSVSSPFCVSMAALLPTFETSDRKLPK